MSQGATFAGITVDGFRDIAVGDGGEWFAAISTLPPTGPVQTVVIHRTPAGDGVFTPGLVSNLSGADSTLVNELTIGDFFQSSTTITVTNVTHGLQVGEKVRLNFLSLYPTMTGPLPTDGTFTVVSAPPSGEFTITHPTSNTCGSLLSPCGNVELVRTIQSPDLNYSIPCLPAYEGVLQMMDDDDLGTPPLITPTVNDSGLFFDSTVLLREGGLSNAPQVGTGTVYNRIWRSAVDSQQDYLLLARMNDPLVSGFEDALVKVDVTGCPPALPVSEQVLLRTGALVLDTGGLRFKNLASLEKRGFAFNDRGDTVCIATLNDSDGLPVAERFVLVNNRSVLKDLTQVPGPGAFGTMVQFGLAAVDLNDFGDYVVQCRVQESPHGFPCAVQPPCPNPPCPIVFCFPFGEALIKGHAGSTNTAPKKFIQTGDAMPDPIGSGEIMLRIGTRVEVTAARRFFPVFITNGGDVIWYGEWGHLDADGNEVTVGTGIFFNKKVIVQTVAVGQPGVPSVQSIGLAFEEDRSAMEVSPNGRFLHFTGLFWDGANLNASLMRVDLGESVPYGTDEQSSPGGGCLFAYPPASLDCTPGLFLPGGSTFGDFPLVGHNLQVVASSAPPGTADVRFKFTLMPDPNFPCGSTSSTCMSGFENLLTGASVNHTVLYTGSPVVLSIPIAPTLFGQTWHCQALFRDASMPPCVLGATNGIRFVIGAQ